MVLIVVNTFAGYHHNESTGRIRNTGVIVNTNLIKNDAGGVFESVQTKEEMGGTVTGDVQPIKGGGSGCSAGYGIGILGLLLAGLVTRKSRKS